MRRALLSTNGSSWCAQGSLAVYMGRKTATFLQGRMLMHGADRQLPVTCIENVSLPTQRAFVSDLGHFAQQLDAADFDGPLIILVGIADTRAMRSLGAAAAGLQSGGVSVGSA